MIIIYSLCLFSAFIVALSLIPFRIRLDYDYPGHNFHFQINFLFLGYALSIEDDATIHRLRIFNYCKIFQQDEQSLDLQYFAVSSKFQAFYKNQPFIRDGIYLIWKLLCLIYQKFKNWALDLDVSYSTTDHMLSGQICGLLYSLSGFFRRINFTPHPVFTDNLFFNLRSRFRLEFKIITLLDILFSLTFKRETWKLACLAWKYRKSIRSRPSNFDEFPPG
ncbi:MAG: hypothetical protein PHW04_18700 [Candidatus Wallbacteria bacterium]|nr:hypothetical protein [Candidatus Wallbacteria bacterium]